MNLIKHAIIVGIAATTAASAYAEAPTQPRPSPDGKDRSQVQFYDFRNIPPEALGEGVQRRYVYGEKGMFVIFDLKKGAVVPWHQHPNEQITYIQDGSVQVQVREPNGENTYRVSAGQTLVIPGNMPHRFVALEDTVDLDVFAPPRQDWLDGTASYFSQDAAQ
ncbi:cupin domain-containing protein [Sinorhizobium meliloti]|nr:cupin domain-containing protein [Sinorhizobium meliloti]